MALLQIGEVFGFPATDVSETAREARDKRRCPFKGGQCTKGSKTDPIGICSLTDGTFLATTCPVRFRQGYRIFHDVAALAFGKNASFVAAPEVRVLRVATETQTKKIGKVDFVLAKVDEEDELTEDFAVLEVQAVYFSGREIRTGLRRFLQTGVLDRDDTRRPDWRSSIQKRLMPQLAIKVPRIRNLHRKFFVATDSLFFANVPPIATVPSFENSEVTWLVYPFERAHSGFVMGEPAVQFTEWDSVLTALREGEPLSRDEILSEVKKKRKKFSLPTMTI